MKTVLVVKYDEKNQLNWKERYEKLLLISPYKSKSNKNYDCIIPVITGGQDFIL